MPRHRARSSRRRRLQVVLGGGLALVVVVVIVGYVLGRGSDPAASAPPRSTPEPSASVSRASSRPSPARSATPSPSRRTPSSPATMPPAGSRADRAVARVLAAINSARSEAGLPGYTLRAGLQVSARRHNLLMARGCGLSHQCPGEPDIGARETAADVQWTAAGENIGEGGPMADTTAAITQMAVGLTQDMLAEKPPDDGHRLNILSPTFTSIGIAIYRASNGTVWMTQDFAN